jgi:hypothetical protein
MHVWYVRMYVCMYYFLSAKKLFKNLSPVFFCLFMLAEASRAACPLREVTIFLLPVFKKANTNKHLPSLSRNSFLSSFSSRSLELLLSSPWAPKMLQRLRRRGSCFPACFPYAVVISSGWRRCSISAFESIDFEKTTTCDQGRHFFCNRRFLFPTTILKKTKN